MIFSWYSIVHRRIGPLRELPIDKLTRGAGEEPTSNLRPPTSESPTMIAWGGLGDNGIFWSFRNDAAFSRWQVLLSYWHRKFGSAWGFTLCITNHECRLFLSDDKRPCGLIVNWQWLMASPVFQVMWCPLFPSTHESYRLNSYHITYVRVHVLSAFMLVTIAIHASITAAFDGFAFLISCHRLHSLLVVFIAPSHVQMQALDLAMVQNLSFHLLLTAWFCRPRPSLMVFIHLSLHRHDQWSRVFQTSCVGWNFSKSKSPPVPCFRYGLRSVRLWPSAVPLLLSRLDKNRKAQFWKLYNIKTLLGERYCKLGSSIKAKR